MELKEIIRSFEEFDGEYKREQVSFAMEHSKEVIPHLIKILQDILDDPSKYALDPNYYGQVYALMLLTYLKETSAHKLLIDIFSLPEDLIDDLFGELANEVFSIALYRTCGGSVDDIKKLVLNINASDSSRISAVNALIYCVGDEIVSREDALKFLSNLFTETEELSHFLSYVASYICDLCPDEKSYNIIKKAYDDNYIYSFVVDLSDFQESIDLGVEGCLDQVRQDVRNLPKDVHAAMSWWACFNENIQEIDPVFSAPLPTESITRKRNKKKKVKIKQLRLKKKKKKKKKKKRS